MAQTLRGSVPFLRRALGTAVVLPGALASWCRGLALAGLALGLVACGGQDGEKSGASQTPAPAVQPALTISSFSPASGAAGTEVVVRGTGLDGVTAADVGGMAANFRIVSASEVRVTVPAGARSGRITLSGGGRAAASGSDFVVSAAPPAPPPAAVPTVTAITPSTVTVPGRITLSGSALDQVASARLGGLALTLAAQSATSLQLDLPANASSGTLTLVDRSGTARTVAQPVTVQAALAVTSFSPTTIARGQTLSVAGRGLDRATAVRFGGGASADIAARSGSTALTVVVPATATSGAITVLAGASEQAAAASALTVLEPIVVTPQTYSVAAAGAAVTLSGSGLAQVTGVKVGALDATISAQSASSLTFAVPAGVNCGAIVLRSAAEPAVAAGSVVVGAGCTLRAAGIELAQVMSQAPGDAYQRLAAGKETWLRAFIVAAGAGTAAPAVRAVATNASGQTLGTVSLTGPATLPVLAAGAALPDSLRYDDAQSFNAELPTAWVQPGLRLRVEAGDAASPLLSSEVTPTVVASGGLRVVLVPLISGSNSPTLPATADVAAELARKLPLAAGRISVSVRAPYTLTSVTAGVVESAQWSAALSELERLRDAEAPDALYYGLVRPLVSSGIAGIGYVNSIGSRSPSLSSLGWDASRSSWVRTMVHELGHNFSRSHAPCGSVAGADANYPYANGALGPTPLFDSAINDVLAPAGQADIMGYCRGEWFSDYNLNGVTRFLEARPASMRDAAKPGNDVEGEWLVVAGRIDADGQVQLAPPRSTRGPARATHDAGQAGRYQLQLATADGQRIALRFEPVAIDHAPGEAHFVLRLPHPGRITELAVQRNGTTMLARSSAKSRAQAAPVQTAPASPGSAPAASGATGPWAEVAREADALVLRWNAAEAAHATLTLVVAGTRHLLALDAGGGQHRIGAETWRTLPAGGHFEVSLSDGVDSTLLVVPRP